MHAASMYGLFSFVSLPKDGKMICLVRPSLNHFLFSSSGKRGEIEMPIFEDDDIDDSDDWDDEEFHSDTCSVKI